MSIGPKVPKLIGIIFGGLFIFCIGCLLWQYFKYYVLNLCDEAYVFPYWIYSVITGIIATILFSVDGIVTLCKINKSKNLVLDIIITIYSFTIFILLLTDGGSTTIYNAVLLALIFPLVILQIISFFRYIKKEG